MFDPRKLRELREASGLTLDAVGSRMEREDGSRTPLTMVSQLEHKNIVREGDKAVLTAPVNIQLDTLLKLCDVFQVSIYDLLTDDVVRKHERWLNRARGKKTA